MVKKITAIIMALMLVFTLASCSRFGKPPAEEETTVIAKPVVSEEISKTDKKIVVLVPSGNQFNESIMAAKMLQSSYPDNVVIKEYSNSYSLAENQENSIVTAAADAASDKSVGAIVFAKATRLTSEAMTAAIGNNPEIKIICIEPEDSIDRISVKCDLVLCIDWAAAAADIVALAKSKGATQFMMMSFNRHLGNTSNPDDTSLAASTAKSAIIAECEKQEIQFVYHNCPDPISAGGTNAVKKDIRDSVTRYKESGKIAEENVAIFSTDYFIQSELINIASENKYIYISPAFPSAYNGVNDLYSVALPANPYETGSFKTALSGASASCKAGLGFYNYPLETVLLTGAVHTAFDMLAGKTTSENLTSRTNMRLNDAAANKDFTYKPFGNAGNVYVAYCPAFETLN